ncbi:MAG: EAL domain-containing protein [Thermodesulfobacteriaceae bacterium]|nr:EAL domain-containing protein [Thermodesulfobacteriaceae bacterium]
MEKAFKMDPNLKRFFNLPLLSKIGIKNIEILEPTSAINFSLPQKIQETPEEIIFLASIRDLEKEIVLKVTLDSKVIHSEEMASSLVIFLQKYLQMLILEPKLESLLKAFNLMDLCFLILNKDLEIIEINDFLWKIAEYSKEELLRKPFTDFFYTKENSQEVLEKALREEEPLRGIFFLSRKCGKPIYLESILLPFTVLSQKYYFFLGKDITEIERIKKELSEKVFLDPFLHIFNFNGFLQSLEEKIKINPSQEILVILMKINNLKKFLQDYGYLKVEKALQYFLTKLKENLIPEMVWGRLEPDLLAAYLPLSSEEKYVLKGLELVEKISKISNNFISVDEFNLLFNLSIGLVCYPYDGHKTEVLLNKAELALTTAKKEGKSHIFYNIFFEEEEKKESQALKLISYALENNRFLFYFQPYFNTQTEEVAGFEALVRILDEKNNIIYPSQFIDVLENSFYLRDFEKWCIKKIKGFLEILLSLNPNFKIYLSLNLTPISFLRFHFINELVDFVLKGYDQYLIFEVTERIFLENLDQLSNHFKLFKKTLPRLKIAIDDFGTGATFLKSFLDYPIDFLKIDRYYISRILEEPKALKMVKTIIDIAKEFGLQTVAEGVETEEQFVLLKNIGCDFIQGFYLSPPLPEEEVLKKFFKK